MSSPPRESPALSRSRPAAYGFGLLAFAAALGARLLLAPVLPPVGFPFLTFFPAVLLAAFVGGLGPGLMVTALSTAAANWFFMPPFGAFGLASAADGIALGFFVAVQLVNCIVIHLMRTSLAQVKREQARVAELSAARARLATELKDRVADLAQREAALAENEARLRTIVETVPVGLVMAELPSGRIIGGNRYVETLLRHPVLRSPDIESYGEWVAFHADGRRVASQDYPLARMVTAGEENPSLEVLYQRGDGTLAWTRILGRPVRDAQGRLTGGVVALLDVDAERRARDALAASEARWRDLLARLHEGVCICEMVRDAAGRATDFRYVEVNPGFERMTGIPVEAARGRLVTEVIPGIERAWIDAYDRVVTTGQARHFEMAVAALGRVLDCHAFALGGPRFGVSFLDVTEARRADDARRAREGLDRYLLALDQRLRDLAEPDAIIDAACGMLAEQLGAARVALLELDPARGPAMAAGDLDAATLRALEAGNTLLLREAALPRDAAMAPAAAGSRLAVPLARAGRLVAVLLVQAAAPRLWTAIETAAAEATGARLWQAAERARAEAALRAGEERLRRALEAGRMGTWEWEIATGRVVWDARQFELFGFDPASCHPGRDAHRGRIHPDDLPGIDAAVEAVLREPGRILHHEFRIRLPDGRIRWLTAYGDALRDAEGGVARLVGLNFDVTARREAEAVLARDRAELERLVEARTAALRETEARLAQSAKMEALGQLAGGVAHDFNNVLQAIQGGIALAARRLARDPEGAKRLLELAADATQRGAAVTGRLLTFARRGKLETAPVDPGALLDDLAQMLRHTLGPAVALEVAAEPGLPPLLADAGQLESVLVNLASNARDAMPPCGGRIRLSAARAAAPPPQLPAGDYLRIAVADDGAGMPPEVLARATEPFFTTKPQGKGTGLGLAMARGFAEQSGGALSIESAPGQGTTVALLLPRAAGACATGATGTQPAPAEAPPAAVLVVDDEAAVRTVLAAGLADRGHAVTEAEDGPAALALLDAGLAVDALVTDLAMPGGMDGLALVRAARQRRPGLPALVVTGHVGDAAQGVLEEAAGTGPFAVLRKPVSVEAVEAQLAALVRSAARAA